MVDTSLIVELKSWIPTASFLVTVGLLIYNFLCHQKLTGNDLKHLATDVKKISDNQDKQDAKIDEMGKDIAYIKGKEENNDKIIKVLEKSLEK